MFSAQSCSTSYPCLLLLPLSPSFSLPAPPLPSPSPSFLCSLEKKFWKTLFTTSTKYVYIIRWYPYSQTFMTQSSSFATNVLLWAYFWNWISYEQYSLVPRPSHHPVFDRLQYTKTEGKAWSSLSSEWCQCLPRYFCLVKMFKTPALAKETTRKDLKLFVLPFLLEIFIDKQNRLLAKVLK